MSHLYLDTNDRGIFSIQLFVRAGSVYENVKEHGWSHLLEHMMFKSKKHKPVKKLLFELAELGGVFNAITNKDYTSFYIRTVDTNWKKAMKIIKHVVYEPNFIVTELESEKKVVTEEFLLYEDDIKDVVFDMAYNELLHVSNPYRKSVKGDLSTIKRALPSQLVEFHKNHYEKCMVFVSCSKQLKADVRKMAHSTFDQYLGKWETNIPSSQLMASTASWPIVKVVNQPQRAQNVTIIMFQGMPYSDKDNIVLEFIWDVLTGSLNSLLMMEIREKRGLVYGITAYNDAYATMGVTGIYFTSSSADTHKVIKYVLLILKRLMAKGLSENVLAFSKASYKNKLRYKLTEADFADERKMLRHYYGCSWTEDDVLRKLGRITNADVIRVCKKIFNVNRMCVVSVGKYTDSCRVKQQISKSVQVL